MSTFFSRCADCAVSSFGFANFVYEAPSHSPQWMLKNMIFFHFNKFIRSWWYTSLMICNENVPSTQLHISQQMVSCTMHNEHAAVWNFPSIACSRRRIYFDFVAQKFRFFTKLLKRKSVHLGILLKLNPFLQLQFEHWATLELIESSTSSNSICFVFVFCWIEKQLVRSETTAF